MSKRIGVKHLEDSAAEAGALATYVVRGAVYGARRIPQTDAGDAAERRTMIGLGLHSVWQGPRKIRTGAPVLRRNKT
jgi:hypothetical protein